MNQIQYVQARMVDEQYAVDKYNNFYNVHTGRHLKPTSKGRIEFHGKQVNRFFLLNAIPKDRQPVRIAIKAWRKFPRTYHALTAQQPPTLQPKQEQSDDFSFDNLSQDKLVDSKLLETTK